MYNVPYICDQNCCTRTRIYCFASCCCTRCTGSPTRLHILYVPVIQLPCVYARTKGGMMHASYMYTRILVPYPSTRRLDYEYVLVPLLYYGKAMLVPYERLQQLYWLYVSYVCYGTTYSRSMLLRTHLLLVLVGAKKVVVRVQQFRQCRLRRLQHCLCRNYCICHC